MAIREGGRGQRGGPAVRLLLVPSAAVSRTATFIGGRRTTRTDGSVGDGGALTELGSTKAITFSPPAGSAEKTGAVIATGIAASFFGGPVTPMKPASFPNASFAASFASMLTSSGYDRTSPQGAVLSTVCAGHSTSMRPKTDPMMPNPDRMLRTRARALRADDELGRCTTIEKLHTAAVSSTCVVSAVRGLIPSRPSEALRLLAQADSEALMISLRRIRA